MRERHFFYSVSISIIFIAELNMCIVHLYYAMSGDGNLMCITTQIFYHLRVTQSTGYYNTQPAYCLPPTIHKIPSTFGHLFSFADNVNCNYIRFLTSKAYKYPWHIISKVRAAASKGFKILDLER